MATSKKVVVEGASVTGPQWKELVRQIVDGELTNLEVQAIIERRNPFENFHHVRRQQEDKRERVNGVLIEEILRIKLGTFESGEELRRAVRDEQQRLGQGDGPWDNWSLDRIPVCAKEGEVELVCVHLSSFPRGEYPLISPCPHPTEVQEWGRSLGLEICPAEVGPQLYLQHHFTRSSVSLSVVMEAISDSRGERATFVLSSMRCSNRRAVLGRKPYQNWNEDRCVFMRRPIV